ncbi:unnamed protein product [Clonostachys chloroleuca]|uniref:Cytochrome P450 n=1 Tax=Clonostachys chloroleuca TaxID=1926264 RepID=A0AA35M0Y9_9HYPO|nr:unnamed protein product [Clonostachys chloroleuca]
MYSEPNTTDSYGHLALLVPLLLWILYFTGLAVYRVTLHPLAKSDAGRSNLSLRGLVRCSPLGSLHPSNRPAAPAVWPNRPPQGPIIRINPDELHCNDIYLQILFTLLALGVRDKSSHFLHGFPPRAQIYELENTIQSSAHNLCRKILSCEGQSALNLASTYSCFAADMISEYSFGQSFGFLDQPGWEPNYKKSVDILLGLGHILRLLPILGTLMEIVPLSVVQLFPSDIALVRHDLQVKFPHQIALPREASKSGAAGSTIFASLLEDSDLPREEKTTARLASEANSIMVGGTESTDVILSLFTYHVLPNPDVLDLIRAEKDTVPADDEGRLPGHKLEQLPYFTTAIWEALRLVHGISGRAARIAPDEDLVYLKTSDFPGQSRHYQHQFVIPRGYAIGMSAYLLHTNENVFPEPIGFAHSDGSTKVVKETEVSTSTYSLLAKVLDNVLAYWDLYICAAALIVHVFRRLSLSDTSAKDVQYDHDELIGKPYVNSNGVGVLVSSK